MACLSNLGLRVLLATLFGLYHPVTLGLDAFRNKIEYREM